MDTVYCNYKSKFKKIENKFMNDILNELDNHFYNFDVREPIDSFILEISEKIIQNITTPHLNTL